MNATVTPNPTTTKTSQEWTTLITELTAKAHTQDREVEELVAERTGLSLESELGIEGAQRRIAKLNTDITVKQLAAQQTRAAILLATQRAADAKLVESATAERERQAKLTVLANKVLTHAAEFTRSVQTTITNANAIKATVKEMIALATAAESQRIDKLLRKDIYQRISEGCGLRTVIDFPIYQGPHSHLTENEFEITLMPFLNKESNK